MDLSSAGREVTGDGFGAWLLIPATGEKAEREIL